MRKMLTILACTAALFGASAGASTAMVQTNTVVGGGEGGGLRLEDPCLPSQWKMVGLCWNPAMGKMVQCMCRRFLICGTYIYVWAELIDPAKQAVPNKTVVDYVYL